MHASQRRPTLNPCIRLYKHQIQMVLFNLVGKSSFQHSIFKNDYSLYNHHCEGLIEFQKMYIHHLKGWMPLFAFRRCSTVSQLHDMLKFPTAILENVSDLIFRFIYLNKNKIIPMHWKNSLSKWTNFKLNTNKHILERDLNILK